MIPAWSPLGRLSPDGLSGRGSPASSNRCEPPLPRRRRSVIPRRLVASGSGLLAPRCLVGIQHLLELAPFYLRDDLDEHDYDDPGPECKTERIEQVGDQAKQLRRHLRSEQVATDMHGQANYEGDPQAPVQEVLPVHRPPHPRQVLAHPGESSRRSCSPRSDNQSWPGARSLSMNVGGATSAPGPSVMVETPDRQFGS